MTERRAPYGPEKLSPYDRLIRSLALRFQSHPDPAFIDWDAMDEMFQEAAKAARVAVWVKDFPQK